MKKKEPDFLNIHVLPKGFQVRMMRGGVRHSKHFFGHSVESYMAAIKHRDRLNRKLPRPAHLATTAA